MEATKQRGLRILGIDPGTRCVGYGLLVATVARPVHPRHFEVHHAGVLRADTQTSVLLRVGALHEAMHELVCDMAPDIGVMESAFFGINAQSALKLGQARGALMAAFSRCKVPVAEIAPTNVKRAITGKGHADKEALAFALRHLLGFDRGKMPYDVTDALAIALSYGIGGIAGGQVVPHMLAGNRPQAGEP